MPARRSALALAACRAAFTGGLANAQTPPAATASAAAPAAKIDTLRRIRETGVLTLGVRETSVRRA